jgi:hypothetical protein
MNIESNNSMISIPQSYGPMIWMAIEHLFYIKVWQEERKRLLSLESFIQGFGTGLDMQLVIDVVDVLLYS